jgi:hydroxyacylglutathione hydrolase
MLSLTPIPAFNDNYIWCLSDSQAGLAAVVDPGDANPVNEYLEENGLSLASILVTHHHPDHTGGIRQLTERWNCETIGSVNSRFTELSKTYTNNSGLTVLNHKFTIIEVPGHTLDHVAYYAESQSRYERPILFCGDTLFSGGCGRLFEGSPEQMLTSLTKLSSFPDETLVCCAHEYTLANLKFARHVDPINKELEDYEQECIELRQANSPTLPSTIEKERAINPFLRANASMLLEFTKKSLADANADNLSIFTALRRLKDSF